MREHRWRCTKGTRGCRSTTQSLRFVGIVTLVALMGLFGGRAEGLVCLWYEQLPESMCFSDYRLQTTRWCGREEDKLASHWCYNHLRMSVAKTIITIHKIASILKCWASACTEELWVKPELSCQARLLLLHVVFNNPGLVLRSFHVDLHVRLFHQAFRLAVHQLPKKLVLLIFFESVSRVQLFYLKKNCSRCAGVIR